jgi:hypothetical protein
MKTFGVDNWIKYGWGSELQDEWSIDNSILHIDLSSHKISNEETQPLEASISAIHTIEKSCPPPYTLFCSGGVDSQAMIWSWHLSGIPFNVVSIKYVSNGIWFNEHDLIELHQFSELHKIKVEYKEFDVISFLENNLSDIANTYDCDSPQICTHIKMTEVIQKGTILFSGNYIFRDPGVTNTHLGLQRYSESITNDTRTIIPFFFLHDPVLAYSFIPLFELHKITSGYSTPNYYKLAGFPVIAQPKKLTGFEVLKEYYDNPKFNERITAMDRLLYANRPSKRTFDILFRHPYRNNLKDKHSRITKYILSNPITGVLEPQES